MILRSILSVLVVIAVVYYYQDKTDVPIFCVALVAGSLVGQVFIACKGNAYPLLRAWMIGGFLAAFVYPLDLMKTGVYDAPTGYSYVAALFGCMVAGLWSMAEGRSFWNGRRDLATPMKNGNGITDKDLTSGGA